MSCSRLPGFGESWIRLSVGLADVNALGVEGPLRGDGGVDAAEALGAVVELRLARLAGLGVLAGVRLADVDVLGAGGPVGGVAGVDAAEALKAVALDLRLAWLASQRPSRGNGGRESGEGEGDGLERRHLDGFGSCC